MASHFLFHTNVSEVVPFNAKYQFPSQATRSQKQTVKIPPKNKVSGYNPGEIIRIEFPAQGYLDVAHSVLQFDLSLKATPNYMPMLQGSAHSCIKRLRVLYGSLVLEDIQYYNILNRAVYDSTSKSYETTSGTCSDGSGTDAQRMGIWQWLNQNQTGGAFSTSANGQASLRCTLNLQSGLLQNKKLLPLKWMSSQLAIELEVAIANDVFVSGGTTTTVTSSAITVITSDTALSYTVDNINFIAELLEFDSSYDAAFYEGLKAGGVPIKFASFHSTIYSVNSSIMQLQIQERSRALKAGFAVHVLPSNQSTVSCVDTHAFFHALTNTFQWRLGGRYFPAQPVQVIGSNNANNTGSSAVPSSGAEAYIELEKALNTIDNLDVATSMDYSTFAGPFKDNNCPYIWIALTSSTGIQATKVDPSGTPCNTFAIASGTTTGRIFWPITTSASVYPTLIDATGTTDNTQLVPSTPLPTAKFIMATSFETSNGSEISGINAEELSDVSLIVNYNLAPTLYPCTVTQDSQSSGRVVSYFKTINTTPGNAVPLLAGVTANSDSLALRGTLTAPQLVVFLYYDALLVIKENNVVDLIQ